MIIERHLLVMANFGSGHCNDSPSPVLPVIVGHFALRAVSWGVPLASRSQMFA